MILVLNDPLPTLSRNSGVFKDPRFSRHCLKNLAVP